MNPIKSRMVRYCLALAFAGTVAACEDVPPPTPKVKTSLVVEEPKPVTPPPPMPSSPPVFPTTEIAKTDPPKVDTKVVDEKPTSSIEEARSLLDAGKIDEGLEAAKRATDEHPKRSSAWNVLGRAQLKSGKRKDAIESFQKAVDLNPKNSFARNNLGLALIYDHQYEDAASTLEEAVELEPVTAYMWNNLGMAYEQLDRLDDARDAYTKATELKSDLAPSSLARLKGVESIVRTAKVDPTPDAPIPPSTPTKVE
ncbi:MAG TPA: tetratricopeptide repeat protein [Polyangia bacterium]|nr:tetratricopeptide repeat protein [Polyangia bacterium]